MKISVVQHRLRANAAEDASALVQAAQRAAQSGAELTFLPDVSAIFGEADPARELLFAGLAEVAGARLVPSAAPDPRGFSGVVSPPPEVEILGTIALMVDDASLDRDVHRSVLGERPNAVVLCPHSESELQAEAVLELAIGLSRSLAGLVIVSECSGAEPGDPGHGGSAIVLLGEIVAEAMGEDDLLFAEIMLPVPQPGPAEDLPTVPPILEQRVAHHRGEKVAVDYPADLSS